MADFFKQSEETIHSKGINAHINSTTKDLSLKVTSKRSNRSAKIYDVGRKGKFIGMDHGPASMGEVVHLYNFENIRNITDILFTCPIFFKQNSQKMNWKFELNLSKFLVL